MDKPSDIVALVGSRICHDLTSPLGAIGNGMELLELSGTTSPEMELISQSVKSANQKIRFFRMAFGAAAPGSELGCDDIASLLAANSDDGRMSYVWTAEGPQPRRDVRAVFLMLMCLESALPFGGEVQIGRDGQSWTFSATGSRLAVNAPLWNGLCDPERRAAVTPAQVQFALLPEALAELGRNVSLKIGETRIEARF